MVKIKEMLWSCKNKRRFVVISIILVVGITQQTLLWSSEDYSNYIQSQFVVARDCSNNSSIKSLHLANSESFGLLTDINDESWRQRKIRVIESLQHNHRYPENPRVNSYNPAAWYQENFEPNFSCPHERRIGPMGYGGKWVCNPDRIKQQVKTRQEVEGKGCLIYSLGSANNTLDFENSLRDLFQGTLCEIHVFDPNLKNSSSFEVSEMIHVHPWEITKTRVHSVVSSSLKQNAEVVQKPIITFQDLVVLLGHEKRIVDVLSINCNNRCEWDAYRDWLSADQTGLVDIRQIIVEVRDAPLAAVDFFISHQNAGFVIFHKEAILDRDYASSRSLAIEYGFLKLKKEFFFAGISGNSKDGERKLA